MKNKIKIIASKTLIYFFLLIILLTIISNIITAHIIPQVKVTKMLTGNLVYHITGEGSPVAEKQEYIDLLEGMSTNHIEVNIGDFVKEGEKLLVFNEKDLENRLTAAERKLRKVELLIEKEKLEIDDSVVNKDSRDLSAEELSSQKNNKLISLNIESLQIDYNEIAEQVIALQTLQYNHGIISSEYDGRIEKINVQEGEVTQSSSQVVIGVSGYTLYAEVPEEYGTYLEIGDELQISQDGQGEGMRAEIIRIRSDNEDSTGSDMKIYADLPDNMIHMSDKLTFYIQKVTPLYKYIVPLSAIHKDVNGTYVMILKYENTIIGDILRAKRMRVNIIAQDTNNAAIEKGNLTEEDSIIISSNKDIWIDERIRIADD